MVKQGIYEQIINHKLKNELASLDPSFDIGKEPIEVEEARKLLSSYISYITRRSIKVCPRKSKQ